MDEPTRITRPLATVLDALLDDPDRELHGWAIISATQLSGPTVYKILERLTEWGWITARWEYLPDGESRPRRRYYTLTANGVIRARAVLTKRTTARGRTRPAFGGGV